MISGSVLAELFRYEKMYSFFPIPFPEKLKLSDKVISGAFEAFLGTAYLLFGLDKVQDYLFVLLPEWEKTSWADPSVNYRSLLQTYLQALKKDFDYFYDFDSRKKKFVAKIVIDGKEVSLAWGKNKKEAGREAAKRLYTILVGKRKKGSNV